MTEHNLQRPGPETPDLYEQDGLGRKAIVHEHYFIGGCDWWITEYNKEKDIAFGFACLGDPQNAELGYVSLTELEQIRVNGVFPVELDMWWDKCPVGEVMEQFNR